LRQSIAQARTSDALLATLERIVYARVQGLDAHVAHTLATRAATAGYGVPSWSRSAPRTVLGWTQPQSMKP
jgi:hypothetical protein